MASKVFNYVKGATSDVSVVGLGFVGLPAALLLAESDLAVEGVDINLELLARIRDGISPIDEESMNQIFKANHKKIQTSTQPGISNAYIIAVPTPLDHVTKKADLVALLSATASVVPVLRAGALVIVESTIPPATCKSLVVPLLEKSGLKAGVDFQVSHCPERLFPGDIVKELKTNERILGGMNKEATRRSREIYERIVEAPLHDTDDVTAEFCKLAENTYRDVNIALANELAKVADGLGINIWEVRDLINKHPRVDLLSPGIGVGGHCIPIDPWFIYEQMPAVTPLIFNSRLINDGMPEYVAGKIRQRLAKQEASRAKIGCYGITYKPNVADERESPALQVVECLKRDGYKIEIFDPLVATQKYNHVEDFLKDIDVLVVLVNHEQAEELLKQDATTLKRKHSLTDVIAAYRLDI